ncbi:unnamed protein product [Tilletia controversa]|uniref:Tryptophan synthase beta chain-like PALP domain-containing protein n=2 Tax=Tilletia TaxID=13289 RepID=A0A177V7S1_9BASI|nr:hypothetical protein CF336_g1229 [Tilletia laevis]KAE8265610.1 hypothetical protein A4X03_0g139 [Tilletia caries]CAD6934057.1 unnamed protein product [Tilletia controversa]KAE8206672.1 hypothetical protein CF335_g1705 [Tilletia laevis]CAD6892867.1 unnamed protein product [Tilletia caries]
MDLLITQNDIERARETIKTFVHRTPLLTNHSLDQAASDAFENALRRHRESEPKGSTSSQQFSILHNVDVRFHLAFKAEHLQKGGAFKARGASNAVLTHLERERKRKGKDFDSKQVWFVTHSSGNHAGALARAAQAAGASAAVVMPLSTPAPKQAAVRGYGARAIMCESTLAAREDTARKVMHELEEEVGSAGNVIFVHPYDDPLVIAGQGTLGEIVEQGRVLARSGWGAQGGTGHGKCSAASESTAALSSDSPSDDADEPPFDLVLSPCGGGGQLSGLSTAVKAADARIEVFGAEPEAADDAARSFSTGTLQPAITPPRSIADGLLTALSPRTYAHIKAHVSGILTTSEASILRALQLTWERTKQLVEPSACVGLGCVLQAKNEWLEVVLAVVNRKLQSTAALRRGHGSTTVDVRVVIIWTGGNADVPKVIEALQALPSPSEQA